MAADQPPLEEMTLRQLRRVASVYSISRYSRMRKDQLLQAIQEAQSVRGSVGVLEPQETVEAAKFDVGVPQLQLVEPDLSGVDADLADLPSGYGESQIMLLPRDPQWAYAYWDVPNEAKEAMRRQGGIRLALRFYDVTDINLNYQRPHSVQQYECDEMAREWYLPIPVSDRDYMAEIGYITAEGRWLMLARSLAMRVPPVYPSDWVEDSFVTISWDEDLRGKTYLELVPPGKRASVVNSEIYEQAKEAEAQRMAGSLHSSMQQAPGSGQMAPGSGQMVTGSGQMVTGSGQMVTGSGQMITGSGQMVTGSGQMVTGSGQMVTGSGQMVTGSGQMMTGSYQMVTGSGQMVTGSGQMITGSGQMVTGSGQMMTGSYQMVTGSGQMMPGSYQMTPGSYAIGSGQMVTGSGQMMPGSYQMTPGSYQMVPSSYAVGSGQMMPGSYAIGSGQMMAGSYQMTPSSYAMGSGQMVAGSGHMMSGVSSYVFPSGMGMWASGVGMSGVGFSASAPPIRPRQFWLVADAELIVYGATEPDATLTIGGRPIKLNPDGTFRLQMSFQDGLLDFPIFAMAADGEQTRAVHLKFTRETPDRRTNTKEEAVTEWLP